MTSKVLHGHNYTCVKFLDAPGVNATVMPGNEFLLGRAHQAFDENGQLKDQRTVDFWKAVLEKFIRLQKLLIS